MNDTYRAMLDEASRLDYAAEVLDSALLAPSLRSRTLREEAAQLRRDAETARKAQAGSGG